jgi:hypothetical protein
LEVVRSLSLLPSKSQSGSGIITFTSAALEGYAFVLKGVNSLAAGGFLVTFDALLNILIAVVVPGLMAVLGGILAAKALPTEPGKKNGQMWFYVLVFVFLFLISVGLAFVQQIRSTAQQRAADEKAARAELKSTGDIKFVQGQLDTMNRVLGMVAANSDPKQLAILLRGVAPDKSTLKKRTLALCSDIESWSKKQSPFPSTAVPGKPTQKEIEDQNAYATKVNNDYFQRFGTRALGIIQEYGAKGFDVRMMEQSAQYGYLPNNLVIQLRAFANRLNDDGTMKQ